MVVDMSMNVMMQTNKMVMDAIRIVRLRMDGLVWEVPP